RRAPAGHAAARRPGRPRPRPARRPRRAGHLRGQPPQPPRHTRAPDVAAQPLAPPGRRRGRRRLLLRHAGEGRGGCADARRGAHRAHAREPALHRPGRRPPRRGLEPRRVPRGRAQPRWVGPDVPRRRRLPQPPLRPSRRPRAPRGHAPNPAPRRHPAGALGRTRPRDVRHADARRRRRGRALPVGAHRAGSGGTRRRAGERLVDGSAPGRGGRDPRAHRPRRVRLATDVGAGRRQARWSATPRALAVVGGARHAATTFPPPCTPGVTAVAKGRGLPLEPSSDELHDLGGAALDLVVDFVGRRPTAPAVDLDGAHDLVDTLLTPPPEEGRPFADLLSLIGDAADVAVDTAGPGYMAYIPGGGLPAAAIAELVTLAVNRYPTVAALAPALTAIETSVTRWLCDLVGFPPEAQGILTSGGSMATFSAIVAARHARLDDDASHAVLYA